MKAKLQLPSLLPSCPQREIHSNKMKIYWIDNLIQSCLLNLLEIREINNFSAINFMRLTSSKTIWRRKGKIIWVVHLVYQGKLIQILMVKTSMQIALWRLRMLKFISYAIKMLSSGTIIQDHRKEWKKWMHSFLHFKKTKECMILLSKRTFSILLRQINRLNSIKKAIRNYRKNIKVRYLIVCLYITFRNERGSWSVLEETRK